MWTFAESAAGIPTRGSAAACLQVLKMPVAVSDLPQWPIQIPILRILPRSS